MSPKYDVLTFGRSSIDLYSNDIGAPFEEITSFGAFVGGSSTNIAVSCRRLTLNTVLLTAIGDDQVGTFIKRFLDDEGIVTSYIPVVDDVLQQLFWASSLRIVSHLSITEITLPIYRSPLIMF